jgi:AcrR family transcriptional regulator
MTRLSTPAARQGRRLKQARSEGTRRRFIMAMQKLLEDQEYADITVEQIAAAAHSTVPNFYKHFKGKRELLAVIVDDTQSMAEAEQGILSLPRSAEFSLARRVAWLVATVADATLRRRRLVRACVAARYHADLVLSATQTARLRASMLRMVEWLLECSAEMDRCNPSIAVRAGTYLALQGLQNALLFEELPPDLPERILIAEAEQMLLRCLAAPTRVEARSLAESDIERSLDIQAGDTLP